VEATVALSVRDEAVAVAVDLVDRARLLAVALGEIVVVDEVVASVVRGVDVDELDLSRGRTPGEA